MALARCLMWPLRFRAAFDHITFVPKRNRYYWEARPENKWRKLMMQVTLPRLGRSPDFERAAKKEDDQNLYGLDVVLHREALEIFESCRMVIVFLKAQMEVTDFFRMKHELRKLDILLDEYPNHVMQHSLKGSRLENLSSLYNGDTLTVFCSEPKVSEMLKITRKNPYLALMGGMVDGKLLSMSQLIDYSMLPPLQQLHGHLSHTLSSLSTSTYNLLQRNQSTTVTYLSQYVKDNSE